MAITNINDLRTRSQTIRNETNQGTNTAIRVGSLHEDTIDTLANELEGKEDESNKGIANGYAPLNGNTQVPVVNLPIGTTSARGILQLAADGEVDASKAVNAADSRLSSNAGHTIQDGGIAETQRENLNFVGFNVTDDLANNRTTVTQLAEGNGINIGSNQVSIELNSTTPRLELNAQGLSAQVDTNSDFTINPTHLLDRATSKTYADSHLAGGDVLAVTPGSGQDGFVWKWIDANSRYELSADSNTAFSAGNGIDATELINNNIQVDLDESTMLSAVGTVSGSNTNNNGTYNSLPFFVLFEEDLIAANGDKIVRVWDQANYPAGLVSQGPYWAFSRDNGNGTWRVISRYHRSDQPGVTSWAYLTFSTDPVTFTNGQTHNSSFQPGISDAEFVTLQGARAPGGASFSLNDISYVDNSVVSRSYLTLNNNGLAVDVSTDGDFTQDPQALTNRQTINDNFQATLTAGNGIDNNQFVSNNIQLQLLEGTMIDYETITLTGGIPGTYTRSAQVVGFNQNSNTFTFFRQGSSGYTTNFGSNTIGVWENPSIGQVEAIVATQTNWIVIRLTGFSDLASIPDGQVFNSPLRSGLTTYNSSFTDPSGDVVPDPTGAAFGLAYGSIPIQSYLNLDTNGLSVDVNTSTDLSTNSNQLPTRATVKDYVDSHLAGQEFSFGTWSSGLIAKHNGTNFTPSSIYGQMVINYGAQDLVTFSINPYWQISSTSFENADTPFIFNFDQLEITGVVLNAYSGTAPTSYEIALTNADGSITYFNDVETSPSTSTTNITTLSLNTAQPTSGTPLLQLRARVTGTGDVRIGSMTIFYRNR